MKVRRVISIIFILLFCILAVLPVAFGFINSFMSEDEIQNRYTAQVTEENRKDYISGNIHFVRIGIIPDEASVEQYVHFLLKDPTYLRFFWNSVLIVLPVLIGQCLLSPLAAFGFENLRWRGKEALFFFYVVIMLMPMQLLMVPNFIVANWLNIQNSSLAVILPAMFHPFGVFLIRQQMKGFPVDVLDAARLEGAGEFYVYRKIVRPNLNSVVTAMLVLLFADNWNIVDQAVVFLNQPYSRPLSAMLNQIMNENASMFFAVSSFYLLPAVFVFLYGQKFLVEGIALSTLKL